MFLCWVWLCFAKLNPFTWPDLWARVVNSLQLMQNMKSTDERYGRYVQLLDIADGANVGQARKLSNCCRWPRSLSLSLRLGALKRPPWFPAQAIIIIIIVRWHFFLSNQHCIIYFARVISRNCATVNYAAAQLTSKRNDRTDELTNWRTTNDPTNPMMIVDDCEFSVMSHPSSIRLIRTASLARKCDERWNNPGLFWGYECRRSISISD